MDLPSRLRAAIVAKGLTQSALAMRANVPEETLSRIMSGGTKYPRIDTVLKLASVLNVTVGWLVDEHTAPFTQAESEVLARAMEILQSRIRTQRADVQSNVEPIARPPIPREYAARGATLVFRAHGDSMRDAGIVNGDRLYVRPVGDVRQAIDEVVVCRVDSDLYVRRLKIDGRRIRLVSANGAVLVDEKSGGFALLGIVIGRAGEL